MSSDELKIIVKIFEFKEIKSNHIFYQRYSDAADARDKERFYEFKLIKFLGYKNYEGSEEKYLLLSEYFIKNFEIEYPKKITTKFKKNILRQIKLKELGI
jgi:hypothetical protein